MAWVLLAVLFLLIAIVLLLPRIPAVRRMAGIDVAEHSVDYVLIPSQFGPADDEKAELPSRILTSNYRNWWVRPVAMTADSVTSDLPPSFNSVSVLYGQSEELEEALNKYRPRQVTLHFREEQKESARSVAPPVADDEGNPAEGVAASEIPEVPTDPDRGAQGLGYALATGNYALATAYIAAARGMTGPLTEVPVSAGS